MFAFAIWLSLRYIFYLFFPHTIENKMMTFAQKIYLNCWNNNFAFELINISLVYLKSYCIFCVTCCISFARMEYGVKLVRQLRLFYFFESAVYDVSIFCHVWVSVFLICVCWKKQQKKIRDIYTLDVLGRLIDLFPSNTFVCIHSLILENDHSQLVYFW